MQNRRWKKMGKAYRISISHKMLTPCVLLPCRLAAFYLKLSLLFFLHSISPPDAANTILSLIFLHWSRPHNEGRGVILTICNLRISVARQLYYIFTKCTKMQDYLVVKRAFGAESFFFLGADLPPLSFSLVLVPKTPSPLSIQILFFSSPPLFLTCTFYVQRTCQANGRRRRKNKNGKNTCTSRLSGSHKLMT